MRRVCRIVHQYVRQVLAEVQQSMAEGRSSPAPAAVNTAVPPPKLRLRFATAADVPAILRLVRELAEFERDLKVRPVGCVVFPGAARRNIAR